MNMAGRAKERERGCCCEGEARGNVWNETLGRWIAAGASGGDPPPDRRRGASQGTARGRVPSPGPGSLALTRPRCQVWHDGVGEWVDEGAFVPDEHANAGLEDTHPLGLDARFDACWPDPKD